MSSEIAKRQLATFKRLGQTETVVYRPGSVVSDDKALVAAGGVEKTR